MIKKIFNELLLYSGQYALFYIIMNFSKDGLNYFNDGGHTVLLFILLFQTIFLIYFGSNFAGRFFGSLIAPFIYSVLEFNIDLLFLLDSAHVMFWVFSIMTGLLQAVGLKTKNIRTKKVLDILNTFLNILIFMFLYYYFDLLLSAKDDFESGIITLREYALKLHISSFFSNISIFLIDKAHIYILIAGLFLSISISVGRIRVIDLTERIKGLFGKYVDVGIRDIILLKGAGYSEKLKLSVMFIDIRNFTTISENSTPENITKMLNIYFSSLSESIKLNNGIIDKYMGDGAMVIFGLKNRTNSCNDAHNCAKDILSRIKTINSDLDKNSLPLIKGIGIGIHYGDVIAGDIGSENRVNYTFIGDTVNIASRLESNCKLLKTYYLVSRQFYDQLNKTNQSNLTLVPTKISLKGKSELMEVYKL